MDVGDSGSKLFDILIVFRKEFLEKTDFGQKISIQRKSMQNYPVGKEVRDQ